MLNVKKSLVGVCIIAFIVSVVAGFSFGFSPAVADENSILEGAQEAEANGFTINVHYIDNANNPVPFVSVRGKLATKDFKIVDTAYATTNANGECSVVFNQELPSGGSSSVIIEDGQGYSSGSTELGGIVVVDKLYYVNVNLNGGKIISGTPANHQWKDNGDGTWSTTAYERKGDNVSSIVSDWNGVKIERNGVALSAFQPNTGLLWHDPFNKNFTTNISAYYNDEPEPGPTPPGPVPPEPQPDVPGRNIPGGNIAQTSDEIPLGGMVLVFAAAGLCILISRKQFC